GPDAGPAPRRPRARRSGAGRARHAGSAGFTRRGGGEVPTARRGRAPGTAGRSAPRGAEASSRAARRRDARRPHLSLSTDPHARKEPAMKFGLRYASLGRYSNGPAAVELAQAAEAAGFESIWTVEHVVVPHGYQSRYPYSPSGRMGSGLEDYPIPDPLIWLAY